MTGLYDIHCHALPGVDDGASTFDDSMGILKMEYDEGVRHIILTPHFRRMMFETPRSRVREQFKALKPKAEQALPGLKLYLGCEYHVNSDMIDAFREDECYRLNGTDHVLLEFSGNHSPEYIIDMTYKAASCGFSPIIAHVERYPALHNDFKSVERLIRMGAGLQCNAESVLGRTGRRERNFCRALIDYDFLSYIAGDAHDTKERAPRMAECAKFIEKKWGQEYAETVFIENPAQILYNDTVSA